MLRIFLYISILAFFAACKKSGDAPSTGGSTASSPTITGVVQLSRVSGATVRAFLLNTNGKTGRLLATTKTNAKGEYSLTIPNSPNLIVLTTDTDGRYVDEASNQQVVAPTLTTTIDVRTTRVAPITAFTAIMTDRALWSMTNQQDDHETAKEKAKGEVALVFGLDKADLDINPVPPNDFAGGTVRQIKASYALSILSHFSEEHYPQKDFNWILSSLKEDLKTDGKLNGPLAQNWVNAMEASATSAKQNTNLSFGLYPTDVRSTLGSFDPEGVANTPFTILLSTTAPNSTRNSFDVTAKFNRSATGFAGNDVLVTNGTVTDFFGAEDTYTFRISPQATGPVSVVIPAGRAWDKAGRSNQASNSINLNFDNTPPTAILSSPVTGSTNAAFPVSVSFSETVSGFTLEDIVLVNATLSSFSGSGTQFGFIVNPAGPGVVTVQVNSGALTDAVGNGNSASNQLSFLFDNTKPTVSLSSPVSGAISASTLITVTFSEPVSEFVASDITTTNATILGFSGSGASYQFQLNPTNSGPLSVSIGPNVAKDAANNQNQASTNQLSFVFDNSRPSITLSSNSPATTRTPISVSGELSELVEGFDGNDILVTNGIVSGLTGSGTQFSFNVTPIDEGSVAITIRPGAVSDAAGNLNLASNTLDFIFDTVPPGSPSVSINDGKEYANSSIVDLKLFASGLPSQQAITNTPDCSGVLNWEPYSTTKMNWMMNPTGGVGTVSVKFKDWAGNESGCVSDTILYDTEPPQNPSIVINDGNPPANYAQPSQLNLTLSAGSGATEMYITNSAGCSEGGVWETFATTKTAWAPKNAQATSANVYVKYRDLAQNETACVSDSIFLDSIAPVALGLQISGGAGSTSSSTVPLAVIASDNLALKSMAFSNSACGDANEFIPYSTTHSWSLSNGEGQKTVFVRFKDEAGNTSSCISSSILVDRTGPTVTKVTALTPNGAYTTGAEIQIQILLDEPVFVTGTPFLVLETGDNDGIASYMSGSGTNTLLFTYTVSQGHNSADLNYHSLASLNLNSGAIRDLSSNGIQINLPELNGPNSLASNKELVIDTVAPDLGSMVIQGGDYTRAGFLDVTLSARGATEMAVTPTVNCGGTLNWESYRTEKSAIPVLSAQKNKTVNLYVRFKDAAGNLSDCVSDSITHDDISPLVPSLSIVTKDFNAEFTVQVAQNSSPDVNFKEFRYALNGNTPGNCNDGLATQSAIVIPSEASRVLKVIACDQVGNYSSPATGTYTFVSNPPSVVLSSTTIQNTNTPIEVSALFSKTVIGFTFDDVSVTNGTVSLFAGNGAAYSFVVNPTGQGEVSIRVPANVAEDSATNKNLVSNTLTFTYDTVLPTVILSSTAGAATNTNIPVTVLFSETVTGFDLTDISLTNGTASGLSGSGSSYSFIITPNQQGLVTISVAPNRVQDLASNPNTTSNSLSIQFDSVAPSVAISSNAPSDTNSPIPVSVVFSEDVLGFVESDIAITNGTVVAFSGSGSLYSFTVNPTSNGTVSIGVPANRAQDPSGNNNSASNTLSFSFDTTQANVMSVTSSKPNGAYTVGEVIPIQVVFSKALTLSNSAQLVLETGAVDAIATYVSGSGTSTLTFNYTVMPGHETADLDYVSANALTLNSGTLRDLASNSAILTLPTPGTTNSLGANKLIVVDTVAPQSPSININNNQTHTNLALVTLNLFASGTPSHMLITNAVNCATGTWEPYQTTKALWSLGQLNATATVYVKFKDAAGNESTCASDSIIHDDIAPTGASIDINSGALTTTLQSVLLTLGAVNATQMYVTNTAGCGSGGVWESYVTSKAWSLAISSSTSSVYVKFRDAALNETACVADSIGTPAVITIAAQPNNQIALNGAATFLVAATISQGATLSYQWQQSTDNGSSFANLSGATKSNLSLTNLMTSSNGYRYRVVVSGTGGASSVTSSEAVLTVSDCTSQYATCGQTGNSCYTNSTALAAGFACLVDGSQINYIDTGNSGFKVWREATGTRILNASGLWSSSADWQKTMARSGIGYTTTDFTALTTLAGRACPTHVFLNRSNLTATNQCVYFDTGTASVQTLSKDTGMESEDFLLEWNRATSGNGIYGSWYEGNIKACADKGMRLPTLYETSANDPGGTNKPTDASPSFGGTRVPNITGTNWTASAEFSGANQYWLWSGTSTSRIHYSWTPGYTARCILTPSQTLISISQQPVAQTALGGAATFSVSGTATNSAIVTYQWQRSTNGGATFSDISGANNSSLVLSGLTASEHNYQYRAVLGASGAQSVVSAAALLTSDVNSLPLCGDSGNSCYSNAAALTGGAARLVDGSVIQYMDSGNGGFKVWREANGTRILNASGFYASSADWQKTMARSGIGYTTTDFTAISSLVGRACPTHVFLNRSNMTATGQCVYYDGGSTAGQALSKDGGIRGEDFLLDWSAPTSGNGTVGSWYEGNIKFCSDKGMRLPTLYETTANDPQNPSKPTDANPAFGGSRVPSGVGTIWTASAYLYGSTQYFTTDLNQSPGYSDTRWFVRCILPPSQTLITINQQPLAQIAVNGNATFSVSATATNNAVLSFQWQRSTDGGITFSNLPGETNSNLVLIGLTTIEHNYQYRAVVGAIGAQSIISNSATLTSNINSLILCGDPGNSCYANAAALLAGTARLVDGSAISYVDTGNNGFKVWKETGGSRIINASGFYSSSGDWQKMAARNGVGYTSSDFTAFTSLAGRVCPTHVFLNRSNPTATNQCVYYDTGTTVTQALNKDSGVEGEDYLMHWNRASSGNGTTSSWYEGNIKACSDKGMRLPTLYETTSGDPGGTTKPTDAAPTFGGTRVPSGSLLTWTASGNGTASDLFYVWGGATQASFSSTTVYVRCILSSSQTLITITQQPISQTAISGTATFSVSATATNSAIVTYQWQRSINGGITFSDISGATNNSLVLSGLTTAEHNYQYRVVVGAFGAQSINSAAVVLTSDINSLPLCGDSGNSCYTNTAALTSGMARLVDGTVITYIDTGNGGFKVWREANGTRILNASGLYASSADWQKTMARSGIGYTTTDFTAISSLAGRSCPTHVFLNRSNMTATGQCVYYDLGTTSGQALNKDAGIEGEDYLSDWWRPSSGNGSIGSWYEGNIKTCADKGMRLPTLYETTATEPSANKPTDAVPSFSGTRVPSGAGYLMTASACLNASWCFWASDLSGLGYNDTRGYPRCILSPSQTLITISQQPVSQVAVSGSATFTVVASATNSANLTYLWQVSTNGGITFSDISGANNSSLVLTGLTALQNNYRYRVIVGAIGAQSLTSSSAPLTSDTNSLTLCGDPGNSCYTNAAALLAGTARLVDGTAISYIDTGNNGFKVWREANGTRILNASGLYASSADWQKNLARGGIGYTTTDFTDITNLVGRACPTHVFLNRSNLTATNQCVYFDGGTPTSQALNKDNGVEGEDRILDWNRATSGNGTAGSWYEGNIKFCADKGMRLPTLYETTANEPSTNKPTDAVPSFSGTRVPPSAGYLMTASACVNQSWCYWASDLSGLGYNDTRGYPRCILPPSQTLLSITQQPIAQTAVSGNATFTVTATATNSATVTYQWQVSINGGMTFTNIAGATNNNLALTGLTPAQHNYQYRVVLGASGAQSINSSVAILSSDPNYVADPNALILCGDTGNSCYDNPYVLAAGKAKVLDGTSITYTSTGQGTFKVWKETSGTRILNASGLWSSSADWQKTMARSGIGYTTTDFTAISTLAGRACPTHVFLNRNNMTASNQCVYFDAGTATTQTLNKDPGIEGEDFLIEWWRTTSGNGTVGSWYEGNIKTCADKGMRLPTLYETTATEPSANKPTDANPIFSGTRVPNVSGSNWTASAQIPGSNAYWEWNGTSSQGCFYGSTTGSGCGRSDVVRCILSPSQTLLTITQQPIAQVAVGGNATFTVGASATNSATVTYQWQRSTNGGVTFTDISGATSSSLVLSGLTSAENNYQYRVILGANRAQSISSSPAPLTSDINTLVLCGDTGNSCYSNSAALLAGTARLLDGSVISYVDTGNNGFKIWKETGGNRILRASGIYSTSADWQKTMARSGIGYTSTDFTNFTSLAGMACPTHVFLNRQNMTATDQCLYYDTASAAQTLNRDAGIEAEDFLMDWNRANSGLGVVGSWYEGNIKTCADKGMRLPTLYETTANDPGGTGKATDANPIFGGTRVPNISGSNWTASAQLSSSASYWDWNLTSSQPCSYPSAPGSGCGRSSPARCVLTPSQTLLTITQQPVAQIGVSGTATYTVSATATNSATPTYQWQVSTNGGVTFTNISGANSSNLILTGLTTAQNNYQYRVIVGASGAQSINSSSALLFTDTSTLVLCGDPGNSCYTNSAALAVGNARLVDGSLIRYVDTGNIGFRVWREETGNRVLNASGFYSSSADWQKTMARSGIGYTSTDFTAISSLAGRACPTHVFLNRNNLTATNQCVYYDVGTAAAQALSKDSGIEGEDTLLDWSRPSSGNGVGPSWYEGNIKTCADKGMRLPTLYETTANDPGGSIKPTDASPIFEGSNRVPASSVGTTWVATSNATGNQLYLMWNGVNTWAGGNQQYWQAGGGGIRCVLSPSQTLLSIIQQPVAQIAVGGSATFSVSAVATNGALVTYQWQRSTNGGMTFTDVNGATSSNLLLSGLTQLENNYQYRVVLAAVGAISITSTAAPITTDTSSLVLCGNSGNSCYTNEAAKLAQSARLVDGTAISYVDTGNNGFRIWKETGGSRILKASGLWSSSNDWQKTMVRSGIGFTTLEFSNFMILAGRVCPTHVFLNRSNMVATEQCLYYDVGTSSTQALNKDTGVEAEDFLMDWNRTGSGSRADASWYEGNIKFCAERGMRLPTLYETSAWDPGGINKPTDASPSFSGTRVPPPTSRMWTSSAYTSGASNYWYSDGAPGASGYTNTSLHNVVCVLTPSQTLINITQNPISQTAVDGNALFTAFANATDSSSVTYQWQVSTNGGMTFSDLNGETNATLNLTGLTISEHGYRYRAIVGASGAQSVSTTAAFLTTNIPSLPLCGDSGNSCYNNASAIAIGTARLPDGTQVYYVDTGNSGFKVWQEAFGTRILRATGLYSTSADWQKTMARSGIGYTSTDFTAISSLAGRVCPTHTFLNYDQMTATDQCVYFDLGTTVNQTLSTHTGIEGQDWLNNWDRQTSGRGIEASWYEGNIKTCADKGMRLPTLYETVVSDPGGTSKPLDAVPTFGGTRIPNTANGWTLSASAGTNGNTIYWIFSNGGTDANNSFTYSAGVRCLLSPSQTLINISQQPSPQTAVNGNATFSITASASDGSLLTYQWQQSPDGGANYYDIYGETSNNLQLTGLTAGENGFRYRVVLRATGGNSLVSAPATLVTQVNGLTVCGNIGNDCYSNTNALAAGTAVLPDGITQVNYVPAYGTFKVWREAGGNRILRPSGLWSSSADWQKTLNRGGTGFSSSDFTNVSVLAGRVCPTHTFLSYQNMTASGQCLYYEVGNSTAQALNRDAGIESQDRILENNRAQSGRGIVVSWYEGNIKTCADIGMRLPTLYETNSSDPGGTRKPTDANPTFGGTRVPSYIGWTWTASAATQTASTYWMSNGASTWSDAGYTSLYNTRCVLPGSPSITISTQPRNQSVVNGTASFSVVATVSDSLSPLYQWQQSTDNGATFNSISGATASTLALNGLTTSSNGYRYRVIVSDSSGSTSVASQVALLTIDNSAPPSGTVLINGGALSTNASSPFAVILALSALDDVGVTQMYITNSAGCASGGVWESYLTSKVWYLGQTNSVATVYAKFRDAAGNESSCYSDTIVHDNLSPQSASIRINLGASYTKASLVDLSLSATGTPTQMYLTNSAGCASGGVWETYSATKTAWVLNQNNSIAEVFAKFRDGSGNESICTSATIIHDNQSPSLVLSSVTQNPTFGVIAVTANFNEEITGFDATDITVTNGTVSGFSGTGSSYSFNVTPTAMGGVNIWVRSAIAKDLANNNNIASNTLYYSYSTTPPNPLNFTATVNHASQITLSWQNGGGATSSFQVAYQLGNTPPVDCNTGTTISFSVIGASTSIAVTSLSVTDYAFRVCARASDGTLSGGVTVNTTTAWYQEAYLKASNTDAGDRFGQSVSVSGDTIVVGASHESSNETVITNGSSASSNNSSATSGAAYVFRRSGSNWAQEAYLKPSNSGSNDIFGWASAISSDTLVVGAQWEDSNQTIITNGSTASPNDSNANSGAAYIFRRTGSNWTQEAYLKSPFPDALDYFGSSVSISGDTLVVGAYGEGSNQVVITNGTTASPNNSISASGAAYVFKRSGSNWAQEAYLKTPNPDSNDQFGFSASISGDTIVVGAMFEDSNQTVITNGATANTNNSNLDSGAAYVFRRTGPNWTQEAFLKAPIPDAGDQFGYSVAISGSTLVVGARYEDSSQSTITNGITASTNNSLGNNGAAFVFTRTGTSWAQQAYLKMPFPDTNDSFGTSVSISADTIVVGSTGEDSSLGTVLNGTTALSGYQINDAGAVFVYRRNGSTWSQEAFLKAANAGADDYFGSSTGISGDTVVVGAYTEDSNQTTITNGANVIEDNSSSSAGAAYVFRRAETVATPVVTSVVPSTGAVAGNQIVIFGSGFRKDATVTVGGVSCTSVTVQGPNEIICRLPSNSAGAQAIQVTNPGPSTSNTSISITY